MWPPSQQGRSQAAIVRPFTIAEASQRPAWPSATVRYISSMIIRVLTATVADRASPRLHELMRQQLPLLREHEGLVYVKLARRLVGREEEVMLFEEWRDPAAMYEWTGPNIERPRLLPGAEDLITDLRITHYEALDVDPSA
jgi:heme-degrading monooxygenase HmoA